MAARRIHHWILRRLLLTGRIRTHWLVTRLADHPKGTR